MTSAELRDQLAVHQAKRPDHLQAMHPNAPAQLRKEWERWVDQKYQLDRDLELAIFDERKVWLSSAPCTGKKSNGRPRMENPSDEAIKRRELRERRKNAA